MDVREAARRGLGGKAVNRAQEGKRDCARGRVCAHVRARDRAKQMESNKRGSVQTGREQEENRKIKKDRPRDA